MQSKQTEALKKALTELSWYEEAGLGRISSCDAIHTVREALAEQQPDWEAVAADQAMTIALLKAVQPAPQPKR